MSKNLFPVLGGAITLLAAGALLSDLGTAAQC
jgi:hypothetical protein